MGWQEDKQIERDQLRRRLQIIEYIKIGVALWLAAAWATSIIVTIKAKTWLLLIAVACMPPIGVIYGTGYWFGAW